MNTCVFCYRAGTPRVMADGTNLNEDVSVCDYCWKLLQDPKTALPLIRGHLTLTERGKMPAAQLKFQVDTFMEKISRWRPQRPRN